MTLLQGEDQLVGRTRWNTIRVQTTHNPPAFCSASSSSRGRCWTKALTPLPSIRQAVPNQTEGKTSWARALAYKEVCGGEKGGSLFRQALRPFLNGWSEATKIPEPHQRGHRIHCQSFVSNTCKPAGVCVCVEVVDQNFLPFQGYCVFLLLFLFQIPALWPPINYTKKYVYRSDDQHNNDQDIPLLYTGLLRLMQQSGTVTNQGC